MAPSPEHPEHAPVGRRGFLKLVAAAGMAGVVPAAAAAFVNPAEAAPAPAATPAVPPAATPVPAPAAAPDVPSADALALAGVLRRRFPDRLDEAQWTEVARSLDGRLDSGKRLRETKLANGDEPDFTFRA